MFLGKKIFRRRQSTITAAWNRASATQFQRCNYTEPHCLSTSECSIKSVQQFPAMKKVVVNAQVTYERNSFKWLMSLEWIRSRVQTPLKSWLFQASILSCLNCVHNCDDHSSLDFKIRSSIYETFHISVHVINAVFSSPAHAAIWSEIWIISVQLLIWTTGFAKNIELKTEGRHYGFTRAVGNCDHVKRELSLWTPYCNGISFE